MTSLPPPNKLIEEHATTTLANAEVTKQSKQAVAGSRRPVFIDEDREGKRSKHAAENGNHGALKKSLDLLLNCVNINA